MRRTLIAFVLVAAAISQMAFACNASTLARSQKIMRASVVALAQAPSVIVTLETAGTITPAAAAFYRELFERLNTNLAETNAQIQALTPESPNRAAVSIALRGTVNLLGDLLAQIAAQHPSVRFSAALIIVRGFAQAALGYLDSGTPPSLDKMEQQQAQLEKLMDASPLQTAGHSAGVRSVPPAVAGGAGGD